MRYVRGGHNEEGKVVKSSPVRANGLSEVQLVNMGKGLFAQRPKNIQGRSKGGRKPRYDRSKDDN